MESIGKAFGTFLIGLVRFYQLAISPILGPRCRFHPTCSTYALQALRRYPVAKAIALIYKRIIRCHPGNPGGVDPIPD